MKKSLLLLLLTVIFIGCSSDDSGDSNTNGNSFNPPSWILGKWTTDISSAPSIANRNLSSTELGFEFKTDDFCYITSGVTTCFKTMLGTIDGTITEEKSDTHYKVSVTMQGTSYNYHFVKVSDTEIQEIISDPNGYVPYYSQDHDDDVTTPSLPITLDFTNLNLPDGATSFIDQGIEFKTGNSYQMGWIDCIEPSNLVIEVVPTTNNSQGGIGLWPSTLIADVSQLPHIEKVIVSISSYGLGRISICDENGLIAEQEIPENGELNTITLEVGSNPNRLYIASLEGIVHSVRIE
ncbi:hypothetical protein [Myroides sp. DW712]|uniref:hypothetical protein n=1 Tax=Myroides sp. DW712 TaxID=3389800 RepID=UPI0039795E24